MQLTLTERLRLAALARAERGGRVVDTYVIDEEGVIDLTALEDRGPDSRASDLAPLGDTAGRYGDAADVSALFEEATPARRGRFRRREEVEEAADPEPTLKDRLLAAHAAAAATSLEKMQPGEPVSPVHTPDQTDDTTPAPTPDQTDDTAPALTPDQTDDTAPAPTPDQTNDTAPAPTPDQTNDTAPAHDRIEGWEVLIPGSSADVEPETSPGLPEVELDSFDGIEIDLREQGRPSNLQDAIDAFNRSNPIEVFEIDIESGIRYGEGSHGAVDNERKVTLEDFAGPGDHLPPDAAATAETDSELVDDGVDCPICGRPASLDFENRFLGINFYSCRDCFHMWHLAADESD
jgi:hypothetical protein